MKQQRRLVALLVAGHTLLVLAYTLPGSMVPARIQALGLRYTRPLFHQQWLLFAPDPPLCSCQVQLGLPDGTWRPVISDDAHYLKHRMARPLADHVQEQVLAVDTVLLPILEKALRNMVRDSGREVDGLQFRLVEHCVTDREHPELREERVTLLRTSHP